jgi:hypothetical protein
MENTHIVNLKKLNEMVGLQQRFNDATNGAGWEKGVAKNGKVINWNRCIYMEAAEFIGSFPWKHWKDIDASADILNAKIELVDIWHFLMSEMIRVNYHTRVDNIYKNIILISYYEKKEIDDHEGLMKSMEGILHEATKPTPRIGALLPLFFDACALIGLSFDELYDMYMGKNCLNQFRQDNGYKEGTYVKIWGEKEDNVYMSEIIKANPEFSYDELYLELGKVYFNKCMA